MISTHILDTCNGMPASNVAVLLEKRIDGKWMEIGSDKTNDDGRINFNCPQESGAYRLLFLVSDHFKRQKQEAFYPKIPVVFMIENTDRKYHVPLLLNPFGYSTYRGS